MMEMQLARELQRFWLAAVADLRKGCRLTPFGGSPLPLRSEVAIQDYSVATRCWIDRHPSLRAEVLGSPKVLAKKGEGRS